MYYSTVLPLLKMKMESPDLTTWMHPVSLLSLSCTLGHADIVRFLLKKTGTHLEGNEFIFAALGDHIGMYSSLPLSTHNHHQQQLLSSPFLFWRSPASLDRTCPRSSTWPDGVWYHAGCHPSAHGLPQGQSWSSQTVDRSWIWRALSDSNLRHHGRQHASTHGGLCNHPSHFKSKLQTLWGSHTTWCRR